MLGLKPNMVSLHINNLVNAGYLKREMMIKDRRKIRLVCTTKSKRLVNEATKIANELMNKMFDGLNEEEVMIYNKSINVVKENIKNLKRNIN